MNANLLLKAPAARRTCVAATLSALLALAAPTFAEDGKAAKTPEDKPAVEPPKTAAAKKSPAHVLPARLEDLVKMAEAGVSGEIIRRFVENSSITYAPTGADIIAMKERGLPDEVTVAMLTREAKQRERTEQARGTIAAPAIVRSLSTDGRIDPESYEFFWYHHAYPRVLAGSHEKLSPHVQNNNSRHSRTRIPWRTDGFPAESFIPGQKSGTAGPGRPAGR